VPVGVVSAAARAPRLVVGRFPVLYGDITVTLRVVSCRLLSYPYVVDRWGAVIRRWGTAIRRWLADARQSSSAGARRVPGRVVYVNVSPRLVRKYLLPTEKIVISVRMHPIAVIRPVIVILAGAVAAGFVTGIAARSGSAGVAEVIWVLWGVLAVWQGWKVATWWRRYFVVTENRLMLITSLVDTDVGMMPLAKVTDMRLHQSTFGQALGYADFIVESAGQDQALSRINFVPYPSQMYQEILSLIFSPKPRGGNGGDLVPVSEPRVRRRRAAVCDLWAAGGVPSGG
jgi:hypothetical protein